MRNTYLTSEAVARLKKGAAFLRREDIASVEGDAVAGEPVHLVDAEGHPLGMADLDLESPMPLRRLGTPDEIAEGIIPRQLRRAIRRRAQVVDDPRYCRLVNDEGDALPGLVIDRFDEHFAVQTTTRAMEARIEEITRSLVEVAGARSVILRNDTARREMAGLKRQPPRVLQGSPPRWTRLLELGARISFDLQRGLETGYSYSLREVRRTVGRLAHQAYVLDPSCFVGGTVVQAGLHGARQIVAFAEDPDAADLARENVEANGLINRTRVEVGSPIEALKSIREAFDLVLLHAPAAAVDGELIHLSLRATRHEGRLVVAASDAALGATPLEEHVLRACEREGRAAWRLLRPAAPPDFPTLAGAPDALASVVLEIS